MIFFRDEYKTYHTQYTLISSTFSEIRMVQNLVVYIQPEDSSNFYIDFQESIVLENNLGSERELYSDNDYSRDKLERLLWL